MRRPAGWGATTLSVFALMLGPWLGFTASVSPTVSSDVFFTGASLDWMLRRAERPDMPSFARPEGGCNCRTVKVNMRNDVRRAEVRTGNAKVVNFNITYVSAAFGDRDIEVDQEAWAVSGDAVAGQLINVDARGPGCVNVEVTATNRVRDSIVRSGDATAINRSIVLLDPGVSAGDLEIDVEQEALAQSGDAIAGQVIGLIGGGGAGRCRGGVDLRAVNDVSGTKVRSGNATFLNEADVQTCQAQGCAAELRRLLGRGAELEVCTGSRCREVDDDELAEVLDDAARADESNEKDDDDDDEEAVPVGYPPIGCGNRPGEEAAAPYNRDPGRYWTQASPTPTPTPTPAPTAGAESGAATPAPTPTTRPGCSPAPSPTASPALLAAPDSGEGDPAS